VWSKVDPGETRIRIMPASTVARTPAGRTQFALELAQAGVVSQDEARRLIRAPDTERALSLYTAALDNIERALEDMKDGYVVVPTPFMNLKMCVWRGQAELNLVEQDGAPFDVMENLRQFTLTAAHYLSGQIGAQAQPSAGAMGPGGPMPPQLQAGPVSEQPLPGAMIPQNAPSTTVYQGVGAG